MGATAEEMARLDEVSATPEPYPYWHQQKWAGERNPPCRPCGRRSRSRPNRGLTAPAEIAEAAQVVLQDVAVARRKPISSSTTWPSDSITSSSAWRSHRPEAKSRCRSSSRAIRAVEAVAIVAPEAETRNVVEILADTREQFGRASHGRDKNYRDRHRSARRRRRGRLGPHSGDPAEAE